MSLVYWDTNLFIYLLQEHPHYYPQLEHIATRLAERGDTICTSIFTRGELLVGPIKSGDLEIQRAIREHLRSPLVEMIPFTLETSDHYARIRADNKVLPADAIHLATAASARVDVFLTNDRSLHRMIVPGIQFVAGIETDIF
jgi:predicted nucleic acid-binding protein